MRVDANVSIRPVGTEALGTKVEVKNMNSLRSLGRAIDYEIARQIEAMESGERIVQETRGWDEAAGVSQGMRSKEGSNDYRYFPEPDLVPVAPSDEMRADGPRRGARAAGRPSGPARRRVGDRGPGRRGCSSTTRCSPTTPTRPWSRRCAGQGRGELVHRRDPRIPQRDRALARGAAARAGRARRADRARRATARCLASLAKDVLDECLREPKRPKQVVDERGLAQVSDEGELGRGARRGARGERRRGRGVPGRRREGAREEARLPLR